MNSSSAERGWATSVQLQQKGKGWFGQAPLPLYTECPGQLLQVILGPKKKDNTQRILPLGFKRALTAEFLHDLPFQVFCKEMQVQIMGQSPWRSKEPLDIKGGSWFSSVSLAREVNPPDFSHMLFLLRLTLASLAAKEEHQTGNLPCLAADTQTVRLTKCPQ